MDVFAEHIVTKKKTVKDYLLMFGIFLLAVALTTVSGFFLFTKYGSLIFLLSVGVVLGSYYLLTQFNVEYEYIVTNGELDIDTIINRNKRKRIISVAAKDFELMAPVGSKNFLAEENGSFTRVINAASSENSESAYYAIFSKDGQRIKLIFEPTEQMVEDCRLHAPRKVYTE